MKKLFALFALLGMLYGLVVPAFAEESAAPCGSIDNNHSPDFCGS